MEDEALPLPSLEEVLICNPSTTVEEVRGLSPVLLTMYFTQPPCCVHNITCFIHVVNIYTVVSVYTFDPQHVWHRSFLSQNCTHIVLVPNNINIVPTLNATSVLVRSHCCGKEPLMILSLNESFAWSTLRG